MSEERKPGSFAAFVLLESGVWDMGKLKADLEADWGVAVPDDATAQGASLVFEAEGMLAAVSLMPAPVPNGEAEQNAQNNYLWPDAVQTVKGHRAHLLVALLPHGRGPIEAGRLHCKIVASCCRQKNALGVYTGATVLQPQFYIDVCAGQRDGELPLLDWIYFGLYQDNGRLCGYTYGMKSFGFDEIEVLDAAAGPEELHAFLYNVAYYVLDSGAVLHDGETIGFAEGEALAITRGPGAALDGETLKIAYPAQ